MSRRHGWKALTKDLGRRALLAIPILAASGCVASTLPNERYSNSNTPDAIPTQYIGPGANAENPGDSKEISRSVGSAKGVLVLWPRLIPKDDAHTHDIGTKLQGELERLAKKVFPDADVEVRPDPERVCPRQGCDAVAVGLVVRKKDGGCAVAVTVARPGQSPTKIVPWVGTFEVKAHAPFREPPESYLKITEFGNCGKLEDDLQKDAPIGDDAAVENALKSAMD